MLLIQKTKKNKNAILNKVHSVWEKASANGHILSLNCDYDTIHPKYISYENHQLLSLGSSSYLGLEVNKSIKDAAKSAVEKYGVQFASSTKYLRLDLYEQLERNLAEIHDCPVVIGATTTLMHCSSLPILIGPNDLVVYDQFVHNSVGMALKLVTLKSGSIVQLRHNHFEQLDITLKNNCNKYDKIWFLTDGVFSMSGEICDVKTLEHLRDRYRNLSIYIDDAHGSSWKGGKGQGVVWSQLQSKERFYVAGSLNKSFACAGGYLCSSDKSAIEKVKEFGQTGIFSGPIQPPMLAAAVMSTQLHLEDAVLPLQDKIDELIRYRNELLAEFGYSETSESPIQFIRIGSPGLTGKIIRNLFASGVYVNAGLFPAVPVNQAGIRTSINTKLDRQDVRIALRLIFDEINSAETNSTRYSAQELAFKF